MGSQNRVQFLKELRSLLEEHKVSISFSVSEDSDTHGLYDPKITINHRPNPRSWKEDCWLSVQGFGVDSSDIEIREESNNTI